MNEIIKNRKEKELIEERYRLYRFDVISESTDWMFDHAYTIARSKLVFDFLLSESYESEEIIDQLKEKDAEFYHIADDIIDWIDGYDFAGLPDYDDLFEMCTEFVNQYNKKEN